MFSLPKLEYSLSYPYPKNPWFLIVTLVLFALTLPVLVIVNIVTLGYELVPALQPQFQSNHTSAGWWDSTRLPDLLRSRTPLCQPQDLGRGDAFRLTASLFDYTVMSAWNTTKAATSTSQVQEQERPEYRGESFANCRVNNTRFDYSLLDDAQTVTVGVICPGTTDYPVYVSMETKIVFAWLLSKDFVGQYYGPGLDLLNINDTDPYNYRKMAFAVLEAISTDSLTIMRGNHLSSPVLSLTAFTTTSYADGKLENIPDSNLITYLNGTEFDWADEANIYLDSIYNLLGVAAHTVNLDLGSAGAENIYVNPTVLNDTVYPNLPPTGISANKWARKGASFYYGPVNPPYNTWAEMLLAGQAVKVGKATGLPKDSSMVTTYLCPSYHLKPIRSLLTSIFVGTATMFLSVYAGWTFLTTFIARRIQQPCLECPCNSCKEKRSLNTQNGLNNSPNALESFNPYALAVNEARANPEKARPGHYSYPSYGGSSTQA
ncbi:hypothetical protein BDV93DRAFT_559646 [Ceratobasidium sp. AG-I]|nr:hypothetical protein BDV93DRAFT_559646 [Ceratobasidium sp. AG-I]